MLDTTPITAQITKTDRERHDRAALLAAVAHMFPDFRRQNSRRHSRRRRRRLRSGRRGGTSRPASQPNLDGIVAVDVRVASCIKQ